MRIALIDLSAIFRAAWHKSEHEAISSAVSHTLSAVTAVTGYDAVAVCCDRPPYKRKEIDPNYKAHREAGAATMYEQLATIEAQLDADGYHILGAKGYEADDIIATIVSWAMAKGHSCDIYSADKDLMQLVGEYDAMSVAVVSTATRARYDSAKVKEKFGVTPDLIPDLLALMGDASDNIPGVRGCGQKTAAQWLNEIGPLDVILQSTDKLPERFRELVKGGAESISTSWRLTQLMTDAPVDPEVILTPKQKTTPPGKEPVDLADEPEATPSPTETVAMVRASTPPVPYDKVLEPQSPTQAWKLANMLHESRMFGDFGKPETVMAVIMTGRALGMDAVASLRGVHIIKGKVTLSAALIVGLVKKSSECIYFRLVSSDDKGAVWETHRKGEPEPTTMSYTLSQASAAGLITNDNWKKRPDTMLRWRAATELARAVYPDITSGLYSPEELQDG